MDENRLISHTATVDLKDFINQFPKEGRSVINEISQELLSKAIPLAKIRDQNQSVFFNSIESIILGKIDQLSPEAKNLYFKILVANLALGLPEIIDQMDLPKSVLILYPKSIDRLSNFLKVGEGDVYDLASDFFRKDISFVLGVSIPCGAQFVDLKTYFLYRSVVRALFRPGNLKALVRFFKIGGSGPWFSIHTEARYLDDFNELGWDECYLRIADLLELNPSIRGMKGTSWFYDPQLLSISPRLSYLQKRPIERGAFMIRHGTDAIDIERATSKSKTRSCLYKEGKYIPVSYTLLWPRRDLISWAKSYRPIHLKS